MLMAPCCERPSLTLGPYNGDTFLAEVRRDRLRASADVVSKLYRGHSSEGLVDFFEGIAANWKGWTGEHEWISVERNLVLSAEGHAGRVGIQVQLCHGAPPYWELRFALWLEANQLDDLVVEARELERSAARAS